jgi:8-oxo-dGTP diphosphatase
MSRDIVQRVSMKAVIIRDGKVLLLRKALYESNAGNEGKWNNPGGRVEPGEHWHDALKREIFEETGITEFIAKEPIYIGEWRPTISGIPTQIICTFIVCMTTQTAITLDKEHDKYEWIDPSDRHKYEILTPESEVIAKYEALASRGFFDD